MSWLPAGHTLGGGIEVRARDAMGCTGESRLPGHRQRADADADAHAMRCSAAEQSRTLDRIGQAKQGRQIRREGGGGERV